MPPRRPYKRKRDVSPPIEPICLDCDGWLPLHHTTDCPRPAVFKVTHPTVPFLAAQFCRRCFFSRASRQACGTWAVSIIPASQRVRRRL